MGSSGVTHPLFGISFGVVVDNKHAKSQTGIAGKGGTGSELERTGLLLRLVKPEGGEVG